MSALPPPPGGGAWPSGTVWAWRPSLWRGAGPVAPATPAPGDEIAPGVKVFHAGNPGSVTLGPADPVGLVMSTTPGAGDFASLVLELPPEAARACTPRSVVTLLARAAFEGPRDRLFGRINLRHGPNVADQTRPAVLRDGELRAEFDLAYTDLAHVPVTQVWVDLLIGDPGAAVLHLADLALAARPRHEF